MFSKTEFDSQTNDSSVAGILMFLIVSLALVSSNMATAGDANEAESQTIDTQTVEAQESTTPDLHKVTSSISREIAKKALTPPTLDATRVRFGEESTDADMLVADAEK